MTYDLNNIYLSLTSRIVIAGYSIAAQSTGDSEPNVHYQLVLLSFNNDRVVNIEKILWYKSKEDFTSFMEIGLENMAPQCLRSVPGHPVCNRGHRRMF